LRAPRAAREACAPPALSVAARTGMEVAGRERPWVTPVPGGYVRPPHAPGTVAPVLRAPSARQAPPAQHPAPPMQGGAPVVAPGVPGTVYPGAGAQQPNANSQAMVPPQAGASAGAPPPATAAP